MHNLNGPWLKLERAEKHLDALNRELNSFHERNPVGITDQIDPEKSVHIIRVQWREAPPPILGLIAGDAIHNMRAALDYLVFELARLHYKTPSKNCAFPIHKDPRAWNLRVTQQQIAQAPAEARQHIEVLQPYHRWNPDNPLWVLHQLDIIDKHQTIMVIGMATFTNIPNLPPGSTRRYLDGGNVEIIVPIKHYDLNPDFTASVLFGRDELNIRVTPPAFKRIHETVSVILRSFEHFFS